MCNLRVRVISGWERAFQDQSWRRFPPEPVLQPDSGAASSPMGKYLQAASDEDTMIDSVPATDDAIHVTDGSIQNQSEETETAASQQNAGMSKTRRGLAL